LHRGDTEVRRAFFKLFEKAARARRRKALLFTILFNSLLIGGVMYGSDASNQLIEKVQELWKGESAEELPKADKKPKKKRA